MTNPRGFAGESGYSKPIPLGATAIGLSPLTIYRLVAGVLAALMLFYGLALATAIGGLFMR